MESQSANTNLSAHKYCKRDLIEIVSIFPVTKKIQLYEIEDHKNGSKFVTDPVLNATVNCPWSLPLYSISDMNVVTLLPHMHVNTILHTSFIQHVYIMLPVNMQIQHGWDSLLLQWIFVLSLFVSLLHLLFFSFISHHLNTNSTLLSINWGYYI